jgi:FOG: EAL domain
MKVVVDLEHRFDRTPDGRVWTQTTFPYSFWTRYLQVFDSVRVVARVRDVPNVPSDSKETNGERVSFAPIPYYIDPWQYLLKTWLVWRSARNAVNANDAVILRVASPIASPIQSMLRQTGRPYAVEVVADPYDVFAPGSVKHPLRPFFRRSSPRRLRRHCVQAGAAAYVTKEALQQRYPCPNFSVGVSDVDLPERALVSSSRLPRQGGTFNLIFVGTMAQLYKAPDVSIDFGLDWHSEPRWQILYYGINLNPLRDRIDAASVELEKNLRVALANDEFRMYYQPIVCLETARISGFEALLRWQHPNQGLLLPDEFLPSAEETGWIVPIGEWVLRQAWSQMRIWQPQFGLDSPLTVSVNLTRKQFFHADLIETIPKILKETNLDASSLRLEIPEYVVMENSEWAGSVFLKIKTLGLQVQIDHCGVSDVSLTHLYQLTRLKYGRFDSLKLDSSLVSGLDASNQNLEKIRKIRAISEELGMGMIATGVETSWQIAELKALKCVYGQGDFFSKPVEGSQVEKLMGDRAVNS